MRRRAGLIFHLGLVLAALCGATTLHGQQPAPAPAAPHPQFAALQDRLVVYRQLAASTKLPDPKSGPSLREFLAAVGDLPADKAAAGNRVSPADLTDALRRFQRRHGVKDDGSLGRETLDALRVPLSTRVLQLELAIERLRGLRDTPGATLLVNATLARIWSSEAEPPRKAPPVNMRATVDCAPITPAAVFQADIDMAVFRPYWNVPAPVAATELLTAIRKDPKFLTANYFEIVRGEGDRAEVVEPTADALQRVTDGTLRIRQRPGPHNALGLIKFVFSSDVAAYLHGTPATPAIHQCVRVDDPVTLAEWVLNSRDWSREAILKATTDIDSKSVPVAPAVRVVVFFAPASVLPDGAIYFESVIGNR